MRMRTNESGRAPNRVYRSCLMEAMGTSKRSSLPKAMVMSMPLSSSSTRTSWIQVWVSIWLPPGSMPRMVRTVAASRVSGPSPRGMPKAPGSSGSTWVPWGGSSPGTTISVTPRRGRAVTFTATGPASLSEREKAASTSSLTPSAMRPASA